MTDEDEDLVSKLIARNQINLLIDVFLGLDIETLKKCLNVKKSWRKFLVYYIFKSKSIRQKLISKAWTEFKPMHTSQNLFRSITDISGDVNEDVSITSFNDGGFVIVKGATIQKCVPGESATLSHVTGSKAQLGKDILSLTKFGSDRDELGVIEIVIKDRNDLQSIYNYKVNDDMRFSSCISGNSFFIRDEFKFKRIDSYFDFYCDLIQEVDLNLIPVTPTDAGLQTNCLGDLQVVHDPFQVFADRQHPVLHIFDSSLETWRILTISKNDNDTSNNPVINVSEMWPHLLVLTR